MVSSPAIRGAHLLSRHGYLQLHRVLGRDGRNFLVKFPSYRNESDDALLEHEFKTFEHVGYEYALSPVSIDWTGEKLAAYYRDVAGLTATAPALETGNLPAACSPVTATGTAVSSIPGWNTYLTGVWPIGR